MSQEIEQLELGIEDARKAIARRDQLFKLRNNREFKRLIEEDYFQKEAARLVGLLGAPQLIEHREEILIEAQAISKLQQYLQNIALQGQAAENALREHEETLDVIRAEMEQV